MLIKITKPDFTYDNECGELLQLVHSGWNQINVITSVRDSTRGGHYHKYNDEGFYVISGSFKLTVEKAGKMEEYDFKRHDMFIIPAFVYHTFLYYEDTILVSMYSNGVVLENNVKDIWS